MIRLPTLFLALLTITTPAHAQDGSEAVTQRTPASAQKFLIARVPDHIVVSTNIVHNANGGYSAKSVDYRAIAIASPEPCTTVYSTRLVAGGAEQTIRIEWNDVDAVDWGETTLADNSRYFTVGLKMPKLTPPNLSLGYDDAGIKDRVLAAARYLKTACDKTASTGF